MKTRHALTAQLAKTQALIALGQRLLASLEAIEESCFVLAGSHLHQALGNTPTFEDTLQQMQALRSAYRAARDHDA
jgi:hypothetical protein